MEILGTKIGVCPHMYLHKIHTSAYIKTHKIESLCDIKFIQWAWFGNYKEMRKRTITKPQAWEK